MKQTHWTFLYVPANEGGVRTIHVNKRMVTALGLFAVLMVLLTSLVTTGYVKQENVLDDLSERERDIFALRNELSELETSVRQYEQQMSTNYQLQERANLLAGLGPLDTGAIETGVGGRAPQAESLIGLDALSQERISEIREQLNKLLKHAQFQRHGYETVLQTLRNDQKLRDSTPSIRPVHGGWLSSRYGRRVDPFTGKMAFHRGLDFSSGIGTPIYATASGSITRASRHGSLGKLVEVDHGNGLVTRYGHLNDFAVAKGDRIERGDLLGHIGNTGRSTGPHLHYEVVRNGRSENPWLYIIRD